ncbi:hypothetical protein [Sphingomonas sp. 28-63-12]|uniref:hypothetical protein n=1 Tax=Sphingomonas sp. 28-63-12 TaxID=1970434 RepID=UPI000BD617B0|nr:MAG: hypothetical protein B7Y47_05195 [Sphingomonas sp. 28-63-12]
MTRVAFSQAQRLYSFSESMVASLAQANMPYAAQALLILQIAELLAARILANLTARASQSLVY